jgi:L-alanine-DL-glutamate epimerase-like enolase superfamily enzyme
MIVIFTISCENLVKIIKINEVKKNKNFYRGNPPPHFGGRYLVFIKLITDKDIIGYGKIYSIPSTKPGLGIELNGEIANKYKYTGTKLHLEMAEI